MTRLKRLIAICAMCILLCGCSSPLSNCKVVDKAHKNAHVIFVPIYNGKTMMLLPQHWPEAWYLTIEGENKDGDICQRTIQVSESEYEQVSIGQEWTEREDE